MMTVIATSRVAFGLTVSETKTEIMCLQTKEGGEVSLTVTAAGQVHQQTVEFVYLGGAIGAEKDDAATPRAWACFVRQDGNI